MSSLIDIGTEAIAIQDALFELQGELTPEMEAALDSILSRGTESLDAGAAVCRRLAADAETCRAEAKRLQERAGAFERQEEALKGRMLFALDAAFGGKVKTSRNTIWGQDAGKVTSIEVSPDADLDKIWATNSVLLRRTLALNKTEIKNRYEAGEPIPAEITIQELPGKRSLRLR